MMLQTSARPFADKTLGTRLLTRKYLRWWEEDEMGEIEYYFTIGKVERGKEGEVRSRIKGDAKQTRGLVSKETVSGAALVGT